MLIPENPINAMAIKPAVMSAMGVPLNDGGGFENCILALTPAKMSIAIVKPTPDAQPNITEVIKS